MILLEKYFLQRKKCINFYILRIYIKNNKYKTGKE
jgi:hypothetical protein